jgi:hypothetical protein
MSGKTSKKMTRGLQLSKGQHPQPDQVQEVYVREAEENQHAHQGSGSHYSGGGNAQIPALIMASTHINQQ